MVDHVISPEFGAPVPRRTRTTRGAGRHAKRPGIIYEKGKADGAAWDTRYVDMVQTADGTEVAGVHFGKLQQYYQEHDVQSDLSSRLATLAIYESAEVIRRGLFYQSQTEVESGVAEMRPGAEGLVIDGLRNATQVRWLVSRLLTPRNVDYERLLALPELLTIPEER